MSSSRDRSPRRAQAFAATTIAKLERGRQARVVKTLGPPYTPQQRRRLEDALSTAVNAAMGLDNPVTRLGFVARHLAAQDTLSEPPEAPSPADAGDADGFVAEFREVQGDAAAAIARFTQMRKDSIRVERNKHLTAADPRDRPAILRERADRSFKL